MLCPGQGSDGSGGSDASDVEDEDEDHESDNESGSASDAKPAAKPKGSASKRKEEESDADDDGGDESGGHGGGGGSAEMDEGDEMLTCRDCNTEFAFTVGEQEFFKEKGFENKPTRCRDCKVRTSHRICVRWCMSDMAV